MLDVYTDKMMMIMTIVVAGGVRKPFDRITSHKLVIWFAKHTFTRNGAHIQHDDEEVIDEYHRTSGLVSTNKTFSKSNGIRFGGRVCKILLCIFKKNRKLFNIWWGE